MKKQTFKRNTTESLIVINSMIDEHDLALAVDTGASHTTIDLAALIIAGNNLKDSIRTLPMEAANGIIEPHVFKVKSLTAVGTTKKEIEICAYDFFSYHLITDFDGVLGLDFFEDKKFCIDLKNSLITIN